MGQYYRVLLISDDGKYEIGHPHFHNTGYKIMEHSWIRNRFVAAVMESIYANPKRVVWMGDYATDDVDSECNFGDGFITTFNDFNKVYMSVWNSDSDSLGIKASDEMITDMKNYFIINETKGVYIDLEEYTERNTGSDGYCVHPLSLLTSVGNGCGGGDYYGEDKGNDVGTWAFDKISVTAIEPSEKYKKVLYTFIER